MCYLFFVFRMTSTISQCFGSVSFFFFKVHGVSVATEDSAETAKDRMKRENRKQGGQSLPNGKVDTYKLSLGQSPGWAS